MIFTFIKKNKNKMRYDLHCFRSSSKSSCRLTHGSWSSSRSSAHCRSSRHCWSSAPITDEESKDFKHFCTNTQASFQTMKFMRHFSHLEAHVYPQYMPFNVHLYTWNWHSKLITSKWLCTERYYHQQVVPSTDQEFLQVVHCEESH